jgi:hypothetical protein
MARIASLFIASIAVLALAAPAVAWKGDLLAGVKSIAEVQEKAERGDYVVVQGEVVKVSTGSGSTMIVTLEDDSGTVLLAVPSHLRRHFAGGGPKGGSGPTGARPKVGRKAQVAGLWDNGTLKDDIWGIRVQKVHPIED